MNLLTKKGKQLLFFTCFLYFADSLIGIGMVYLNGKTIECMEYKDLDSLIRLTLIMLVLRVLSYMYDGVVQWFRSKYRANAEQEVRTSLVHNFLRRPFSNFRRENNAFYLNIVNTDAHMYENGFLNHIPFIVSTAVSMIMAAVMLWLMHPAMLIAALIMAVFPVFIGKPFANWRQKTKTAYSKASENHTNILKETIEGCGVIRSNSGEEICENRYNAANAAHMKAWAKDFFVGQMTFESLMSVAGFAGTVCILVGGWLVVKGMLSVGMVYAALNYFSYISNGFSNLTSYLTEMRSTKKTIEKLTEQRDMPCPEDSGSVLSSQPEISYENISFGFGDRQLYSGLTEKFTPGGCYVIVGESGSGKSTLVKLLLKYYDNYKGNISLGGNDIRGLSEREVYRLVGVVDQTPYLFNASLYENITLFGDKPGKDSEEYKSLLKSLNLTALAECVGDLPLGDFGDNISGGERQRINIARAMGQNPKIMIFDEPTTGLDPENAAMITEFIFDLKGVTRIVVSHNWAEDYLNRFDKVIKIGERNPVKQ